MCSPHRPLDESLGRTPVPSTSGQVPAVIHGLEGRYATALYTAAFKKKSLETVEGELKKVQAVIQKDANVRAFLHDPVLNRVAKKQGVKQLLGDRYSELTRNFFDVLADNGRMPETAKILDSYFALMAAHRGELSVTVTTAKVYNHWRSVENPLISADPG